MACAARKIRVLLGRLCTSGLQPQRALRHVAGQYTVCRSLDVATRPAMLLNRRHFTAISEAELGLLSCVKEEIGLEQGHIEHLPEVTGFTTSINGCLATLHKQHGNNEVTVELDTHHAVEVIPEELGDGDEEGEPIFVPFFTVTITNTCGSRLQVDCSFDEHGQYIEQGKEWDNLTVDSVSVIAANAQSTDAVYTITADNLSTDLSESLLGYLQESGIDETFAFQVVRLYQVHEHRCYLEHSLKALQNFLQNN